MSLKQKDTGVIKSINTERQGLSFETKKLVKVDFVKLCESLCPQAYGDACIQDPPLHHIANTTRDVGPEMTGHSM